MKTRLIFLRHGQSVTNAQNIFTGHADVPLSQIGETQAKLVSDYLKNIKIDKVYSSDSSRAYYTVKPTADSHGLDIHTDVRLRELYLGEWELKDVGAVSTLYGDDFSNWRNDPEKAKPTNGESLVDFLRRVKLAVTEIAEGNTGNTVLIATHGGAIRIFESSLTRGGLSDWLNVRYVSNASLTIYDYEDGNFTLVERDVADYLGVLVTSLPKNI